MPDFGIGELIAAALTSALGVEVPAAVGTGLVGAGLGAAGSGLMGGDPLTGAITGGLTGGLIPALGGTSGWLTGQIGETAADALIGAGAGAIGAGATGGKVGPAALMGGIGGGALGALDSSGILGVPGVGEPVDVTPPAFVSPEEAAAVVQPTAAEQSFMGAAGGTANLPIGQMPSGGATSAFGRFTEQNPFLTKAATSIAPSLISKAFSSDIPSQVAIPQAPTEKPTFSSSIPYSGLSGPQSDYLRRLGILA